MTNPAKPQDRAEMFFHQVELFADLDEIELASLAARSAKRWVPEGQIVVEQDVRGDSLFIVESGGLSVDQSLGYAPPVNVGLLGPGDFFGEMSLLTGAPRSARVVANVPTTLYEIGKSDIEEIVRTRPEITEKLSRTLAKRQSINMERAMGSAVIANENVPDGIADSIQRRIKAFFGLPVSTWGKIVGGIGAYGIGGPIAEIMAKLSYRHAECGRTGSSLHLRARDRQTAYTTTVVVLAAKLADAGGVEANRAFDTFQRVFDISADEAGAVRRLFSNVGEEVDDARPYARQLIQLVDNDRTLLEQLFIALLRMAEAGNGYEEEAAYMRDLAIVFGFHERDIRRLKGFGDGGRSSNGGEEDPYEILGVSQSASEGEIKAAYRRYALEHHPDRLMGQGLPPEFVSQASAKFAVINNAYKAIWEERAIT